MGPHGVRIVHPGLPNTFRARARTDINALVDGKSIRVRSRSGAQMTFDLTDDGRQRARLLHAAETAGAAKAEGARGNRAI